MYLKPICFSLETVTEFVHCVVSLAGLLALLLLLAVPHLYIFYDSWYVWNMVYTNPFGQSWGS